MNKQDWIEYFELLNGRKPTPEEYFAAKAAKEFEEVPEIQRDSDLPTKPKTDLAQLDLISPSNSSEVNQSKKLSMVEHNNLSEDTDFNFQNITFLNLKSKFASLHIVDQRGQNVSFGRAIKDFFRGYFDFKGYTTRKGYWYVFLFNVVCSSFLFTLLTPSIIMTAIYYPSGFISSYGLSLLLYLLWLIPGVCLTVRRFRDAGLKGWGIFWVFVLMAIPIVNLIVAIFIIYILCQGTEHFVQENETFFFKGRNQLEAFPNSSLPERPSTSGRIGSILFLLVLVATVINTYTMRTAYDASSSDYTTESYSSEGSVVDLSTYDISLYVDGESGAGTAHAEVDSVPYVSNSDSEIRKFLENPKIKLSKSSGLSNGDTVEVELTLDETRAKKMGLTITGSFYEYYKVSKLDDKSASTDQIPSSLWNDEKSKALSDYMVKFGQEMNQSGYQKISTGSNLYWTDGQKVGSDYQIVDAYEYWFANETKVHRYFFAIKSDGSTAVLYSQDTNGNHYNVKETANSELPTAFASIVGTSNVEKDIENFLVNFRKDINRSIQESKDYVAPYFDSKNNATYQQIIDIYLSNPYHYARHESKTDRIYDIEQSGGQVTFTLDYTTTTYFTDGTSPKTVSMTRHYVLKKERSVFYIVSFDNI